MFCVVYRFPVKPEHEAQFKEGWRNLTEIIKRECGGLGSRLHQNHDGAWIAYAQWPDEKTWAEAKTDSPKAERNRQMMRECYLDGQQIEVLYKLSVVDDLLLFDRS